MIMKVSHGVALHNGLLRNMECTVYLVYQIPKRKSQSRWKPHASVLVAKTMMPFAFLGSYAIGALESRAPPVTGPSNNSFARDHRGPVHELG